VSDKFEEPNSPVTDQRFRFHMAALWTLMVSLVLGVSISLITHSDSAVASSDTSKSVLSTTTSPGKLVEKTIATRIRRALPNTKIDWVRYTPIKGVYEFKAGKSILYTDSAGQFLLVGHVWDLSKNRDLTQASKDKYLPKIERSVSTNSSKKIPWKTLPLLAAVRYGNPKGKKIAIFHDPDCPYCQKMKQDMLKSNKFDVYQIMYPIKSLHPKAFAKSQTILCTFKKIPKSKCDMTKELNASIAFAKRYKIRGTPTVVSASGHVFVGYRPAPKLMALIAKTK